MIVPKSDLGIEVRRDLPAYIPEERILGDGLGLKSNEHPGRVSDNRPGFWTNQVLIKLGMQILVK